MTDETPGHLAQGEEVPSGDVSEGHDPARHGGARHAQARHGGPAWRFFRELLTIAVIALVISFVIKTFLVQAFWIPSGSMEETLNIGDRVLVSKIKAGPMSIDRGDIVVFEDPGGWLPASAEPDRGPVLGPVVNALEFVGLAPTAEGNHLIKRVIATAGDHVECCDAQGRMSVNGQPLEEDYLYPNDIPSQDPFDVTVAADSIWVMGDHRSNSRDSRANDDGTGATGSVPTDHVVGQAMALVWPLGRAEWFDNPSTLSSVPAP